jgi:hypothetical protein
VQDQFPGRIVFANWPKWPQLPGGAFLEGDQMTHKEYAQAEKVVGPADMRERFRVLFASAPLVVLTQADLAMTARELP